MELAGDGLEQLGRVRLAVRDEADDGTLDVLARRERDRRRRRRRLVGAVDEDPRHRFTTGTMQPSGPQSGSGSPAGRTRRDAPRAWIVGAQVGA